jgi:hypothetical protein
MEKLLKQVLENQVILFKVLTELSERSKGIASYKPYQAYDEELEKERERLNKALGQMHQLHESANKGHVPA